MEQIEVTLNVRDEHFDAVVEHISVTKRSLELWQPVTTPTGLGFIVGFRFVIFELDDEDSWFYLVREIREGGFDECEWGERSLTAQP